jgi:hypothetical protein
MHGALPSLPPLAFTVCVVRISVKLFVTNRRILVYPHTSDGELLVLQAR